MKRRHCLKMSRDSADLFLSWEWEWSSWDVSSFFSFSLWKTRQSWTPCFMVRPKHNSTHTFISDGDNLVPSLQLLSLFVCVVQCLLSFPSPAWWAWPTLWSRAASSLALWASTYGRCDEPLQKQTSNPPPSPFVNSQPFPPGGASSELRLRCDDVILGGCRPPCPLPHYHPPHV